MFSFLAKAGEIQLTVNLAFEEARNADQYITSLVDKISQEDPSILIAVAAKRVVTFKKDLRKNPGERIAQIAKRFDVCADIETNQACQDQCAVWDVRYRLVN